MTHRELLVSVWGPGYGDDTQVLRAHVANLRRKIEPAERAALHPHRPGGRLPVRRPEPVWRSADTGCSCHRVLYDRDGAGRSICTCDASLTAAYRSFACHLDRPGSISGMDIVAIVLGIVDVRDPVGSSSAIDRI